MREDDTKIIKLHIDLIKALFKLLLRNFQGRHIRMASKHTNRLPLLITNHHPTTPDPHL